MKKILIVTQNYKIGGLETNIKATLKFLKSQEFELFLITSKDARLEEIEFLLEETLLIENHLLLNNDIEAVNLIRKFININQISAAIIHPFNTFQIGSIACKLENVPYFIMVHGPININMNDYNSFLFNKYFTFPNAQSIFVVSDELSDLLYENYHVRSKVLKNPIDFKVTTKPSTQSGNFVFISRLDEDKIFGLKEVIKFVSFYNQKGNRKRLTIIGDGSSKDNLIEWINENYRENSWIELVGYQSDVVKFINEASVVFGMGRVVLEALTLEKTTVLAGYDGIKGLVNVNNLERFMYANFSGRGIETVNFEDLYFDIQNVNNTENNKKLKEIISGEFGIAKIGNTLQNEISDIEIIENNEYMNEVISFIKLFSDSNENLLDYYQENIQIQDVEGIQSTNIKVMKNIYFDIHSNYKKLKQEYNDLADKYKFNYTEIEKYKEKINEKDTSIKWFQDTLDNNNVILERITKSINEKDNVYLNLIEDKKNLIKEINDYEKITVYNNQVNFELNNQLLGMRKTKAWRILNRYYKFMNSIKNIKVHGKKFLYISKTKGLKEAFKRSVNYLNSNEAVAVANFNNNLNLIELYSKLAGKYKLGEIKGIAIIPSAFEFDELYNQRTINLAKHLAKEGYAVIYVAWQWNKNDELTKNYECFLNQIYQVPLFDFLETDFSSICSIPDKKFIITFPAEEFNKLVVPFRENSFDIVYDIMDEWEEFYNTGESPWYKKEIEEAIILNSDVIFAVSEPLKEKFKYLREDIMVIGNGYDEKVSKSRNISLKVAAEDKRIHMGYFGHLTTAWFDWDLVFDVAKNKNMFIHIIGYGADEKILEKITTFNNIKYYGKVHPGELHGIVKEWHVGIIPFKKSNLATAVDPIKIYEYLFFGLPTISTGIPHIGNYPLTTHCEDAKDVINTLEKTYLDILNNTLDLSEIEDFLADTTWESRFTSMLKEIENADFLQALYEGEKR